MDGAERAVRADEANPGDVGATEAAFATETARLAAALMALEARIEVAPAAAAEDGALAAAMAEADARAEECARLRASNERLREICAGMRDGAAGADAAMAAEVEAMTVQRASERAELDRLIRALGALVEEPA
jgi:hypothetical protein